LGVFQIVEEFWRQGFELETQKRSNEQLRRHCHNGRLVICGGHAGALNVATMHDGTDHEPTNHGAALMMCKARSNAMELATTTGTEQHDRVTTVSDINDRYAHDDADVIEIKQAMDSTSIALVPIDAANIMRVVDADRDRDRGGDCSKPEQLKIGPWGRLSGQRSRYAARSGIFPNSTIIRLSRSRRDGYV
jgi:hypothetical protein